MTLWGGRFSEPTDEHLRALNDSIGFDRRLYAQDIAGSIAYTRALTAAGVLTDEEARTIVWGLETILTEFERGEFVVQSGDEDIHTAVERRLVELIGPAGGKLHTGRSRNDQVATDFRLWVMAALVEIETGVKAVQTALLEQAARHIETLMPGYTHLQPAQPISAGHWLMSFFWMLARDCERLAETRRRTGVCPLGSGALAGTPLALDRAALAQALNFHSYSQNSLDAVSDRDFAAEMLFDLALLGTHLSRLAEDLIIYSSPHWGFVTLNDRYSTGSSLMPQKRNPDPMELARGKAGRLIGNLTNLLAVLKGQPSAYNKDLQEDKEAVFDSFDTMRLLLPVIAAVIATLKLNPAAMRSKLSEDMLATDLADYLVRKGMPFREAHHIVGRAVRAAAEQGIALSGLSLDVLRDMSALFEADVSTIFDFDASVARRSAPGGTAPDAVRQQMEMASRWLEQRG